MRRGAKFTQKKDAYTLRGEAPEDWKQLFETWAEDAPPERFVYLWSLDEVTGGSDAEAAALMGTDAATIRDFLTDYRERNARDELLLALDASGTVVARSDTFAALTLPEVAERWLQPALSGRPVFGVIDVEGRLHHLALVPAESA